MTSRFKAWGPWLKRPEAWESKSHRVLFYVCAALLSFYFSYVLFLSGSAAPSSLWETAYSLLWFVIYAALIFTGLLAGCRALFRSGHGMGALGADRKKLSLPFFAISTALSLVVAGVSLMAAYPGAVTYDVYNQWTQAQTGQYNSWHPVFHTLLLWLGNRLTGSYSGVVMLQIAVFSGAMAYLMTTLHAWGLPKLLLLITQGLILTSPLVDGVLMSAGKDNAMTLGVILLCAQSVNLYQSRGAWIKKPLNALTFGGMLAFATLARHNGFFFTASLLICAVLTFQGFRKGLALAAAAMITCLGLITGPLYGSLDIVAPNNTLEESVGIPMAILCDTRAQNPELLTGEAAAFLETLMPEEAFAEKYVLHNYNSIKFTWPRELISRESPEKLLRMTLQTIQRNPRGAFQTFNAVTDLVWDVTGRQEGVDTAKNSGDLAAYRFYNTHANQIGKNLQKLFQLPRELSVIRWLTQNIGVQVALLLLCGLMALYRRGPAALALCLPVLLYNLGTMLLLCGNDARFFQFSMVICLPTALLLWHKPREQAKAPA